MPTKRLITAEDLYNFKLIRECRISPDGGRVVYSIERFDKAARKAFMSLWTVATGAESAPGAAGGLGQRPLSAGAVRGNGRERKGGDSADPRPLTRGDHRDWSPRWSPDGRWIAFLSNRKPLPKDIVGSKTPLSPNPSPSRGEGGSERTRMWIMPASGGAAACVCDLDGEYAHPEWSPDGRYIAFEFTPADPIDGERVVLDAKGKRDVVYRHYTRLSYKSDGRGFLPQGRTQIYLIEMRNSELGIRNQKAGRVRIPNSEFRIVPLTSGPWDHTGPCWSPDSKEIVFAANRNAKPELNSTLDDLWRVKVADAVRSKGRPVPGPVRIPTPAGPKAQPSWSPDGKWIAYVGHDDPECGWGERNTRLWIVSPDGKRCREVASSRMAPPLCGNYTIGDLTGLAESIAPMWTADLCRVVMQMSSAGRTDLRYFSVDAWKTYPRGEIMLPAVYDRFRKLREDYECCLDASQPNTGDTDTTYPPVAVVSSTAIRPPVLEFREEDFVVRATSLHDPNADWISRVALGKPEAFWIGKPYVGLHGWLLRPPHFDPNNKYPAILQIHGGPRTQYGHVFMHEFQVLAAAGYIVMYTNPRGSQGYGEAHARAIRDKWGTLDYDDLMAATDYLAKLPEVDSKRLGVIGGSYGGFMVNWIIGHTNRFAAAITDRCVSNLLSMAGSSDIAVEVRREFFRKWPWEAPMKYWERSPMAYAKKFQTPTLIIHSENDFRCDVEQAEQVFVALQANGVESEMIRFPDESHGLSRGGRPDRRVARLNKIVEWFDRFLKRRK